MKSRFDSAKVDKESLNLLWSSLLNGFFEHGVLKKEALDFESGCSVCGALPNIAPSFLYKGFQHWDCACQNIVVYPRLNDIALEQLYSAKYYDDVYSVTMIPVFEERLSLIGRPKAKYIENNVDLERSLKILDVGAGVGEVAVALKEKGHSVVATEYNSVAIENLERHGVEVYRGGVEDLPPQLVDFDVICAWGVLEHVVNAKVFLETCARRLRPGGFFVGEVPSAQSFTVRAVQLGLGDVDRIVMGEQHLALFSVSGINRLFSDHGFTNVAIQSNGLDAFSFSHLFVDKDRKSVELIQSVFDSLMVGDLLRGVWQLNE